MPILSGKGMPPNGAIVVQWGFSVYLPPFRGRTSSRSSWPSAGPASVGKPSFPAKAQNLLEFNTLPNNNDVFFLPPLTIVISLFVHRKLIKKGVKSCFSSQEMQYH